MQFTFIFGTAIFLISLALSLYYLFGVICRNVGVTSFGISIPIFMFVAPVLFWNLGVYVLRESRQIWGIAFIFIFMNLMFVVIQYFLLVGSVIFTKKYIYRVTKFLLLKRYTYDQVIGYTMKKDSGWSYSRFGGKHKAITYEVQIFFTDKKYSNFALKNEESRKAIRIKGILEEHNCRRDGRIKLEDRSNFN